MEKDEIKTTDVKIQENKEPSGALKYFSSNTNFVFVLKKTERLSSAVYLITGFFDDQEPLKWKLRNLSGSLLSSSLLLKDSLSSLREKTILEMEGIVLEIGSQLSVAKNAGLISEMNYGIINKEFAAFADSLSLLSDKLSKQADTLIKEDYFNVKVSPITKEIREESHPIRTENNNVLEKDNALDAPKTLLPTLETLEKLQSEVKDSSPIEKGHKIDESFMAHRGIPEETKPQRPLKEFGAVAVKKNSRQSIIISLLRRKKEIMIKDVSPLIEGCSEKTIQRELLSMVDKGLLKKHGEKRWSRYSLA